MFLKRVFTVWFGLNSILLATAKSIKTDAGTSVKKLVDNDPFWNSTVSELFGPKAAECNNSVFPLKKLFKSQSDFRERFPECKADFSPTSDDVTDKLCLSLLYNLHYVCKHVVKEEPKAIPESEIESFDDKDLCQEMAKLAVPIANCHDVKACNVSSMLAFQFKNSSSSKPLCDACSKNQSTR